MTTSRGVPVGANVLANYFENLVNQFFKIIPMREAEEATLSVYIESLQIEVLGCCGLVYELQSDARFLTLVAILQYFTDNPDSDLKIYRREIFKAISICNKLKDKFGIGG